jgi:hypothetical protein
MRSVSPRAFVISLLTLTCAPALALTPSKLRPPDGAYAGRVAVLPSGQRVRLGRFLNSGYFSVGHVGWIEGTGERVAIKVWSPKWQEHVNIQPTYAADDRALRQLSKRDAVWVSSYGVGTLAGSGERVLVTEFADGAPLKANARARGVGKAVRLVSRVLNAIDAGHQLGYGNQDLNLGNEIMRNESTPTVRLFDTGNLKRQTTPQMIAADVQRAAGLLVNVLLDAKDRGLPMPQKLARIAQPRLRQLLQRATRGDFRTAQELRTALGPYYWADRPGWRPPIN